MNLGDVVLILVGEYKGGNGRVSLIKGDKVKVTVDPFGKTVWFKRSEIK